MRRDALWHNSYDVPRCVQPVRTDIHDVALEHWCPAVIPAKAGISFFDSSPFLGNDRDVGSPITIIDAGIVGVQGVRKYCCA
jgi:hypothetical protein